LQAPSDGHNAKKKKVHRKKWVEEVKNEMLLSRLDCNDKDGAYESELQKDGDFLRLKLYKMFTKSWMVIDPDSALYWRWNCLIIFLVLFSSVSFPISLSFGLVTDGGITYLIELVFLLDVLINFHMVSWKEILISSKRIHPHSCPFLVKGYFDAKKNEVEMEIARVRHNYLHGWFFIELIGSVPVEMIIAVADGSCSKQALEVFRQLHLLKMCRICRLRHLKLVKDVEFRAGLPPSMVSVHHTLSVHARLTRHLSTQVRLTKLLFAFLVILHWVACSYWAIVRSEGFRDSNDHDENFWIPVRLSLICRVFSRAYCKILYTSPRSTNMHPSTHSTALLFTGQPLHLLATI
jgi:hypothetical protein